MTTFNLQRNFLNVKSGKQHFQMFFPDEFKRANLPPVNEAYQYMKDWGASDEQIITRLISKYIPFRLVKGNHLINRTLVTGLIGARGSGKSCSASEIIIFDYLIRGTPVWSNMEIKATFKYKDIEKTFITQDVDKMELFALDRGFQNGCIYLDEINLEFAEARRSVSNRNLKFTNMLQQLRHRNLDLVYTTQLDTFLDNRLRFQTDLYGYCKDAALTPGGRADGAKIGNFTFIDFYDYSGIYTGDNYHTGDPAIWSGILWIKPFWHTYDTFLMQGSEGGPDISFQIKESERLQEMKEKRGRAQQLINYCIGQGVYRVPETEMWQLAGIKTHSEKTSLGMQLAECGVIRVHSTYGREYIMPDNGN